MQIAIFDIDPQESAMMCPDVWTTKLSIEASQLCATVYTRLELSSAPRTIKGTPRSNKSHPNHPLTKWVQHSFFAWEWVREFGIATINEAMWRGLYKTTPHHANFFEWMFENPPNSHQFGKFEYFYTPIGYENFPVQKAHQQYFLDKKQHIANWTKRDIPKWFIK